METRHDPNLGSPLTNQQRQLQAYFCVLGVHLLAALLLPQFGGDARMPLGMMMTAGTLLAQFLLLATFLGLSDLQTEIRLGMASLQQLILVLALAVILGPAQSILQLATLALALSLPFNILGMFLACLRRLHFWRIGNFWDDLPEMGSRVTLRDLIVWTTWIAFTMMQVRALRVMLSYSAIQGNVIYVMNFIASYFLVGLVSPMLAVLFVFSILQSLKLNLQQCTHLAVVACVLLVVISVAVPVFSAPGIYAATFIVDATIIGNFGLWFYQIQMQRSEPQSSTQQM